MSPLVMQNKSSNKPDEMVERSCSYYNFGCSLHEQGNLQDAIAAYREALRLYPIHIEANYNMGSALQELCALQEAEVHYIKTIKLMPSHHM